MDDIKLRYAKVEDLETVEALVDKAIQSARTMKQKVQYAAVGLMIFSVKDAKKSVELVNKLVHNLGAGVKAEGLVKYMVDKGGFRLNAKGDEFESVKSEQWVRDNLQAAKDTPWWTYAPATPFKGFVLTEELRGIIKRAKTAVDTAKSNEEKAAKIDVDYEMIRVLEALLAGNPVQSEGAIHLIERIVPKQEEAPAEGKQAVAV